jgi:Phage integrase, N-terminal SAM-like domain
LPPFISFSTSYPDLNSAVLRHTDNERFVGKSEVIERCRRKAAFSRAFEATKLRRLITPVSIFPCFTRAGRGKQYADGSATVERRKRGPDVWCFRWREGGPDGRRTHRRIVLGTAGDLKGIASARNAVVGLRRKISVNDIRVRRESIALADLWRHFQQRELVRDNTRIAYSTRKAYEGYLKKWIEPQWGEYRLFEIRAVEVESWLKSLNRAPGTRCKIRNVMSLLFNHGRRHVLLFTTRECLTPQSTSLILSQLD